jgi:hypothetical protein
MDLLGAAQREGRHGQRGVGRADGRHAAAAHRVQVRVVPAALEGVDDRARRAAAHDMRARAVPGSRVGSGSGQFEKVTTVTSRAGQSHRPAPLPQRMGTARVGVAGVHSL